MPSIRNEILEEKSSEALGLKEFDEKIFKDKVERIEMLEGMILRFVFKNGDILDVEWNQKSRKDSWNEGMKQAAQNRGVDYVCQNGKYTFTHMIVCGKCKHSYTHCVSGDKWICWTKSRKGISVCNAPNIPDKELRRTACKVLEIKEFDESIFKDKIDRIEVLEENTLKFVFKNGDEKQILWEKPEKSKEEKEDK